MMQPAQQARKLVFISLLLLLSFICAVRVCAQDTGGTKPAEAGAKKEALPAWPPPNVDDEMPAVAADVPCPLRDVLQAVAGNVKELVSNLREFTATERFDHRDLKPNGHWSNPDSRVFKYLVDLHEARPGMLVVDEYRSGNPRLPHPGELQDLGLPALALVFHPDFADEYDMTCDGLTQWRGQPAWRIRFEQRPDRTSRLRAFVVGNRPYPLRLKGRAWIAAGNHQLLRLETDLLNPVPQIRLFREHIAVNYQPVRFQQRNEDLWLPEAAEVFMDFRGHRYWRRHTFSDFFLFDVAVQEKHSVPKEH